jgi:hypothetical protein
VEARDRLLNVLLLAAAVGGWAAAALFLSTRAPDVPDARVSGALLLGGAAGLTTVPLAWLAAFGRRSGIAHRGDWARATRRGLLVGGTVTLLVLLRVLGAFSIPLAAFVVVLAVVVELILTARR